MYFPVPCVISVSHNTYLPYTSAVRTGVLKRISDFPRATPKTWNMIHRCWCNNFSFSFWDNLSCFTSKCKTPNKPGQYINHIYFCSSTYVKLLYRIYNSIYHRCHTYELTCLKFAHSSKLNYIYPLNYSIIHCPFCVYHTRQWPTLGHSLSRISSILSYIILKNLYETIYISHCWWDELVNYNHKTDCE